MDHGQCWPESDAFFVRSELGSIMEGYRKHRTYAAYDTLGNGIRPTCRNIFCQDDGTMSRSPPLTIARETQSKM